MDIGCDDAVASKVEPMNHPSLLGMEEPSIQAYPPAAVIAEKFQAMVVIGMINGRMRDHHDLWVIPNAINVRLADLCGHRSNVSTQKNDYSIGSAGGPVA
ncbi:nucleotidyl transferase AbiEii/AbiGii toxin family protein [Sphingomonas sp. BT553]|uniref:Nucleotidyl transferase AbiEii/AbiGii toxin family protein n=1 Tax=Sphingomonas mollis TaxID=2795726 RepID=A0ABS0XNJ8_9SPHN|nr:nucleotidyl transferase AbiEii/AbiGii toxin family protein [Sphingomonas sp. BT553]